MQAREFTLVFSINPRRCQKVRVHADTVLGDCHGRVKDVSVWNHGNSWQVRRFYLQTFDFTRGGQR